MTKETYLDMCSQLDSEPVESEMPVALEDLPDEVTYAYHVLSCLEDDIDSINGIYRGKRLSEAPAVMDMLVYSKDRELYKVLLLINALEKAEYNRNKPNGK